MKMWALGACRLALACLYVAYLVGAVVLASGLVVNVSLRQLILDTSPFQAYIGIMEDEVLGQVPSLRMEGSGKRRCR